MNINELFQSIMNNPQPKKSQLDSAKKILTERYRAKREENCILNEEDSKILIQYLEANKHLAQLTLHVEALKLKVIELAGKSRYLSTHDLAHCVSVPYQEPGAPTVTFSPSNLTASQLKTIKKALGEAYQEKEKAGFLKVQECNAPVLIP